LGFVWNTGRVERRNDLPVFGGMPRRAFSRGRSCVSGCYFVVNNAGLSLSKPVGLKNLGGTGPGCSA